MKYNLSKIMLKAWKVYRKTKNISFAEALHRAWLSAKAEEINAKRIEDAKHAAGITEETNTFAKWKELGYKVKAWSISIIRMFSYLGKQGRRRRIQGKFLWKVSGRNNLIKSPYQSGNSDKGKVTRQTIKIEGLCVL